MIRRVFDDLGSEPLPERGRGSTVVILIVVALAIVAVTTAMEDHVEDTLRVTEGTWQLESSNFPDWVPAGFVGSLGELHAVPGGIPLRSANWRRRVARALEENPWVASVESIDRTDEGISFRARFLRPVVAVRCPEGFLLLDSTGRVIDLDRTGHFDRAWRIPLLVPLAGDLPSLLPGTRVRDPEVEECLAVVREVWDARIPQRFPGELGLVEAYTEPGIPGLLWRFHDRFGTQLRWGRSPVSPYPALLDSTRRLENLEMVLSLGEARREMGAIELFEETPEVVRRR